jgi:hypothetical protein
LAAALVFEPAVVVVEAVAVVDVVVFVVVVVVVVVVVFSLDSLSSFLLLLSGRSIAAPLIEASCIGSLEQPSYVRIGARLDRAASTARTSS